MQLITMMDKVELCVIFVKANAMKCNAPSKANVGAAVRRASVCERWNNKTQFNRMHFAFCNSHFGICHRRRWRHR